MPSDIGSRNRSWRYWAVLLPPCQATLKSTHTGRNTPLHHPDQRFCLVQERENAKPRTGKSFQQTNHFSFANPWTGFNLPWVPSTEKWQQTGLQFFITLLSCIPHTHCIFSNPLQKSFVAISGGARRRPHQQAALTAHDRQESCSLHRVPCPASSPAASFHEKERQKRQAFQPAHPLFLLDGAAGGDSQRAYTHTSYAPEIWSELQDHSLIPCDCHLTISQFTSQW